MNSDHEQNAKETIMSLTHKIFNDPTFFRLRFLILFSAGISLVTIIYNGVLFSCGLYLLQNGFLVYITTLLLLYASKLFDRSKRIKLGVPISFILGIFYGSVTLLVDNIQYYFFGFRERAFSAMGLVAPQTTIRTLWVEIGSQLVLLSILVLISTFAGFLASITNQKKILH
jgi:hypothetical protein